MSKEIWKDIKGFDGKYQLSTLGRVKSFIRNKEGKLLKPRSGGNKNPYLSVGLCFNGVVYNKNVHSLMGVTFLDEEYLEKGLVVGHKDDNKKNNILNNLRVISHRDNTSKKSRGTSKYVGVHFCNTKKRFLANIMHNGKVVYLGSFKSEEKCHIAYQNSLKKINSGLELIPDTKPTSLVKWIYFHSKSKRWRVQIKGKYHGSFKTEKEAIKKLKTINNEF